MYYLYLALIMTTPLKALEVIRPIFKDKIYLKIVRASVDSFSTYSLINHNGREMTLVCANNQFYGDNTKAFVRYRNFYGETVEDFALERNRVCLEMGKLIETSSFGVDENRPFLMTLSKKTLRVEKIVYPRIDPYADKGHEADLLPKKNVLIQLTPPRNEPKKAVWY